MMLWVATAVCALSCAGLVIAELYRWEVARAALKIFASGAFIVVAAVAVDASAQPVDPTWERYQTAIILGLVCGALGDVALLGRGKRAFLAGIAAFTLGHLIYGAACALIVPPASWLATAGFMALVPPLTGIAVLVWLWPHLGDMRIAVIKYVVVIVVMLVAAISVGRSDAMRATNRHLLAAGAALFFVSDLAVARDKFVHRSAWNRAWGLPCYYAGQLLIALSIRA